MNDDDIKDAPLEELEPRLNELDCLINGRPPTEHHTPELMAARHEQELIFWEIRRRQL